MKKLKGFSLIELMIVVGIIGILSLIGLPMYKNYVERVKLTEVVLDHLNFTRQLETEFAIGGGEAVFTYTKSFCLSAPAGVSSSFICDTNLGLSHGSNPNQLYAFYNPQGDSQGAKGASVSISQQNQADTDYNIQMIDLHENKSGFISMLVHFPKRLQGDNQTVGQRSGYGFVFVNQKEDIEDSYRLKITSENLGTYFADFNRWHCGGVIMTNAGTGLGGPIPKSIRPRMCNFTTPDGNYTDFLED